MTVLYDLCDLALGHCRHGQDVHVAANVAQHKLPRICELMQAPQYDAHGLHVLWCSFAHHVAQQLSKLNQTVRVLDTDLHMMPC